MHYIYIDETGGFGSDNDNSLVGGFVTTWKDRKIIERIDQAINITEKQTGYKFCHTDIHMSPLLHSDSYSLDNEKRKVEKERFAKIQLEIRHAFAKELLRALQEMATCVFMCHNNGFTFGTQNPQTRYGNCLMLALRKVVTDLRDEGVSDITVAIEPRSKSQISDSDRWSQYDSHLRNSEKWSLYHNQLVQHIKEHFGVNAGYDPNRFKFGYYMADVACYYLKKPLYNEDDLLEGIAKKLTSTITLGTPDRDIGSEAVARRLANEGEFYTAYRIATDNTQRMKILDRIGSLDGMSRLKQLSLFLELVAELIERRTIDENALDDAGIVLGHVMRHAWKELEKDSTNREVLGLCLSGLSYVTIYANHKGDASLQGPHVEHYEKLLAVHGDTLPSKLEREEGHLSLLNRAYNVDFNTYRFEPIINSYRPVVDKRIQTIGHGKDDLTGEMCGTIGQAYAFWARTDDYYAYDAADYFEGSLDYFLPTHRYHAMSVNFLTTLYWQCGDIKKAIDSFGRHSFLAGQREEVGSDQQSQMDTAKQWLQHLYVDRKDHPGTPFDAVCLLRIIAEMPANVPLAERRMAEMEQWFSGYPSNDHPHELIAKWVGVLLLVRKDYDKAVKWLTRSIDICQDLGFTVQTIGLSSLGLRAVAKAQSGDKLGADADLLLLRERTTTLCNEQAAFNTYIDQIGGMAILEEDLGEEDIQAISRWLPFAYA